MGWCERNTVTLQTNRTRCALNKEILDSLNEESISGVRSGRAGLYISMRSLLSVLKKVSQLLKYYSNFFLDTQTTADIPTSRMRVRSSLLAQLALLYPVEKFSGTAFGKNGMF